MTGIQSRGIDYILIIDIFKRSKNLPRAISIKNKRHPHNNTFANPLSSKGYTNKKEYNRMCKIIGTDILLLYEAILPLVSVTSIQILSLEVVFAYSTPRAKTDKLEEPVNKEVEILYR